jgi:hypothetical protein
MKNILIAAFISTLLLACNNNAPEQDLTIIPENKVTLISDTQTINKTDAQNTNANNLPTQVPTGANVNLQQPAATMPQNIVNNKTGAVANPPHGQPGHVCGTTPTGAATPTTTTTTAPQNVQTVITTPTQIKTPPQQINNIKPAVVANTGNSKKNPAHGQPGHRCDIPAGAPLNSAPQKTTTPKAANTNTPVAATPTIVNPSTMPALQSTQAVQNNDAANGTPALISNTTGAKLNPEHGKPGHDCKVAVGQPLPNK